MTGRPPNKLMQPTSAAAALAADEQRRWAALAVHYPMAGTEFSLPQTPSMSKPQFLVLSLAFAALVWMGQADGFNGLRLCWAAAGLGCVFVTRLVLRLRLSAWLRWILATATLSGLFFCLTSAVDDRTRLWTVLLSGAFFAFLHVEGSSRPPDGKPQQEA